MKPAPFTHHRPETVEDVLELLAELEDAELLAGNQSLGIVMANRLATPDHLVDLNGVDELASIDERDDEIRIGAMTSHRTLERSDRLAELVPMLPEAAEQIAGPSVRNQGTIGGSIGEADPASNYPAALVALEDRSTCARSRKPEPFPPTSTSSRTCLRTFAEELIESVSVPTDPFPPERSGMAFLELKRAAQTWPTVSAASAIRVDDPSAAEPVVEDAESRWRTPPTSPPRRGRRSRPRGRTARRERPRGGRRTGDRRRPSRRGCTQTESTRRKWPASTRYARSKRRTNARSIANRDRISHTHPMLEFTGENEMEQSKDELWPYFTDTDVLAECAPGCKEMTLKSPRDRGGTRRRRRERQTRVRRRRRRHRADRPDALEMTAVGHAHETSSRRPLRWNCWKPTTAERPSPGLRPQTFQERSRASAAVR